MPTYNPNGAELQFLLDVLQKGSAIILTNNEKEASYTRVRLAAIVKNKCGQSVMGFAIREAKLYGWSFIEYPMSRLSPALQETINQTAIPVEHFGYGQEVPTYETIGELKRQLQEPFATHQGSTTDEDFVRAAEDLIKHVEGKKES